MTATEANITFDVIVGDPVEVVEIGNLGGPAGPAGPPGPPGPTGATGPAGPPGATAPTTAVHLTLSAAVPLPDNTVMALPWDRPTWDNGSMWSAAQSTRLVAPTAGLYLFTSTVRWGSSNINGGDLAAWVGVNGTNARYASAGMYNHVDSNEHFALTTPLSMAAGDYAELFVYQSSGSTMLVDGDNVIPSITNASLVRLGPPPT